MHCIPCVLMWKMLKMADLTEKETCCIRWQINCGSDSTCKDKTLRRRYHWYTTPYNTSIGGA